MIPVLRRGASDAGTFRFRKVNSQVESFLTVAYTFSFLSVLDVLFVVLHIRITFLFLLFSRPPSRLLSLSYRFRVVFGKSIQFLLPFGIGIANR